MGCDEVYELGRGVSKDIMVRENLSIEEMFLKHVKQVAKLVRQYGGEGTAGREVVPVIWDDELRKVSLEAIQVSLIKSSHFVCIYSCCLDT